MASFKEIKQKLRHALALFPIEYTDVDIPGTVVGQKNQPGVFFKQVNKMKMIVNLINETNFFQDDVHFLLNSTILLNNSNSINTLRNEGKEINARFNHIYQLGTELLSVLNSIAPNDNPNSINIKLPPNVSSLDDLSNVTRALHLALSQVLLNDQINGEEKIASVENGSIWLNVLVGTTEAASLIGSIAWSAVVVMKKIKELRLFEEQIRAYRIQNVKNEAIAEVVKVQLDSVVQAEAELIRSEYFIANPEDYIERIKHSIKTLSDIIDKGGEIHPAITAPEQVSNLFPSMKNLIGVESKIKKITEGN